MWQQPIYDRTFGDVQSKNSKAYINTQDLNRIEGNIKYLSSVLGCDTNTKIWADGEFIFISDIERINFNLQILTQAYILTRKSPEIPKVPYTVYSQWNDVEKIIYDIYNLFYANKSAVAFCNEVYAGTQIGVI